MKKIITLVICLGLLQWVSGQNYPVKENVLKNHLKPFREVRSSTEKTHKPFPGSAHLVSNPENLFFRQKDATLQQLDGLVWTFFNDQTSAWENDSRFEYYYDAGMHLAIEIYGTWSNPDNKWINAEKDTYKYDNNGNITKQTVYYWDSDTGNWANVSGYTYSYNANGYLVEYTEIYWLTDLQDWINNEKKNFSYNDAGNVTEIDFSFWDANNNEWVIGSKYENAYTNSGNLENQIISYNNGTDEWSNYQQHNYTYDGNGNKLSDITYNWDGISSWTESSKSAYSYDENDNLLDKTEFGWDPATSTWINYREYIYMYNSTDNVITGETDKMWDNTNAEWVNMYSYEFIYDSKGNFINETDKVWDETKSDWINYYKTDIEYTTSMNASDLVLPFDENTIATFFSHGRIETISDFLWDTQTNTWLQYDNAKFHYSNFNPTGIGDVLSKQHFKIYPNPVTDILTINLGDYNTAEFTVISENGEKVIVMQLEDQQNLVHLKSLKPGNYIIELRHNNQRIYMERMVKL